MDEKKRFFAVRHGALNGNDLDLERLAEDTFALGSKTYGRDLVVCFEGDLVQTTSGEIILSHESFSQIGKDRYQSLRSDGLASSLHEVIDRVERIRAKGIDIWYCFEPKLTTKTSTIKAAIGTLVSAGITHAYFDSFFSGKLAAVQEQNHIYDSSYMTSLHLLGNIGNSTCSIARDPGCDIITVPSPLSVGQARKPMIMGAVGSTEAFKQYAKDPNIMGCYVRFGEGSGIKGALTKLYHSVRNTTGTRKASLE